MGSVTNDKVLSIYFSLWFLVGKETSVKKTASFLVFIHKHFSTCVKRVVYTQILKVRDNWDFSELGKRKACAVHYILTLCGPLQTGLWTLPCHKVNKKHGDVWAQRTPNDQNLYFTHWKKSYVNPVSRASRIEQYKAYFWHNMVCNLFVDLTY